MNAILFCTSYIRDQATWNDRYLRWLTHYQAMDLGASRILMIDDSSPFTPASAQLPCVSHDTDLRTLDHRHLMLRFPDRLGRSGLLTYPGWWRSFLHALNVARQLGAQKIIHIESDAYVLSPKLAEHIRTINSGWTTLWSEHFRIPETAVQVICEDQFEAMASFQQKSQHELGGHLAENLLPFTCVDKRFKGDRYGDMRQNRWFLRSRKFNHWPLFDRDFFWARIPDDADFATQVTERLWGNSLALSAGLNRKPGQAVG
jgi:hypothetical protein